MLSSCADTQVLPLLGNTFPIPRQGPLSEDHQLGRVYGREQWTRSPGGRCYPCHEKHQEQQKKEEEAAALKRLEEARAANAELRPCRTCRERRRDSVDGWSYCWDNEMIKSDVFGRMWRQPGAQPRTARRGLARTTSCPNVSRAGPTVGQ
jgi:hypothetical protein